KQIGDRFSNAVRSFAEINGIPVLHLNTPDRSRWDDRKLDHVREYVNKATAPGVVAIVVAQEVQKVFMGYRRRPKQDGPQFGFDKADRRVTVCVPAESDTGTAETRGASESRTDSGS